jgi:hypothetical protein
LVRRPWRQNDFVIDSVASLPLRQPELFLPVGVPLISHSLARFPAMWYILQAQVGL